jgi:hypothetical protein
MEELKDLNTNCNDCKFLKRSLVKRQQHVDFHYELQKKHFNTIRLKLLEKGEQYQEKSIKQPSKANHYNEKAKNCFKEARQLKFVFDEGSCSLFFGRCTALNKDVSFIPNTVILENFNCFVQRTSNQPL